MKWLAYDSKELFNLEMLQALAQLHKQKQLTDEQHKELKEKYSSKLYVPVIYIRALLYLATIVAVSAAIAISVPVFSFLKEEEYFVAIFILLGIALAFILDSKVVKERKHYRSGIDDALLHIAFISVIMGVVLSADVIFNLKESYVEMLAIFLTMILAVIPAVRYTDRLFTLLAYGALIYFVFSMLLKMEGNAVFLIPLVIFVLSVIITAFAEYARTRVALHYEVNVQLLLYSSLILSCVSVNYLLVKELSNEFIFYGIQQEIPYASIFLSLTAIVPAVILIIGVKYRKIAFIRVGFVALALAIPIFTQYFNVNNLMRGLLLGGASLFIFALLLYRRLKSDGKEYTVKQTEATGTDSLVRTIITVSTAATTDKKQINSETKQTTEYGGGDFGGGGAGDSF